MKKFVALLLPIISLTMLSACSSSQKKTEEKETAISSSLKGENDFTGEYIVNANYVKNNLKDIILVDARGEEAEQSTIKGATAMSWQYLANVEEGESGDAEWGLILSPSELAERLGEKGISKEKEIILFSSTKKGWGEDGRIAWELLAAGYQNVKMVDGGFSALKDSGLETQKGGTDLKPVEVSIDSINNNHRILTTELEEDYQNYKIVDTRSKKEYKGAILYGEQKGGHLPDAINIEFTSLFNSDGTLKSNNTIKKIFIDAGLSPDDQIVVYCTAGIRSAFMELIMDMTGYKNVKNYDGSYYTWAATETVEK
ncbi:sulfurtransferase [Enterococcus sp. ALS3]|uniref:thiosulfate sulfurtransferase n=1 Tax=Enterococcus alishanensis TaxID=1303817 RepID=A0ABS6THX2_9ENTE|nr:rhodanese-like domain-containing protein [Enterococcus alishanensis]MBV7392486.1 sulfurtransferase [Enterococcus alishanensis]